MDYDVIVVGARVAGAPTAMLLARRGYRVLVLDRATFPSDTLSTHVVHPSGVAALARWGLLDRLVDTGCPPIVGYTFDFGPVVVSGTPNPVGDVQVAYAPRRTVLDHLLMEGAVESGAQVRQGCHVDGVVMDGGRVTGVHCGGEELSAYVVVGADGRSSSVAKAVGAADYHTTPRLQYSYYTYFSGLPTDRLETFIRPDRGFACAPTHDGLTMVVQGWPYAEARAYKADVAGNFMATLELAPEFAVRVGRAERRAPFLGGAVPGWFRKPYGDGYVLVGDAGYNKDPITAQGITDAFLDAERCAEAIDRWLGDGKPYDDVMTTWHQQRDEHAMPLYELTGQFATLEPPPPEMQQLLAAVQGDRRAMDEFVSVIAGSVSPLDFFSEDNVARLLAAAPGPTG